MIEITGLDRRAMACSYGKGLLVATAIGDRWSLSRLQRGQVVEVWGGLAHHEVLGIASRITRDSPADPFFSGRWRHDDPTAKQVDVLTGLGLPVPKTRGEASDLITARRWRDQVLSLGLAAPEPLHLAGT